MEHIKLRARHFAEGGAVFGISLLIFTLLYINGAGTLVSASSAVGFATVVCILAIIFHRTGLSIGCIGAIIYLSLFISVSFDPILSLNGEVGDFVLRAESQAKSYTSYSAVDCALISLDGKPIKKAEVRLIMVDASPRSISPGDRIEISGKLSVTSSSNRFSQGSFLTLKQTGDINITPQGERTLLTRLSAFSLKLSHKIRSVFKGDEGALLSALLCGDRSGFTSNYSSSLRASGLSHIAAVSGMHLSILLAIILFIFPKKAAIIISLPLMLSFAAMTGFSPSITRALIMSSMLGVAFLIKAEYDALTALVTAGVIIGCINPFALCSVSFLLSFFSTLGIILFSPRILRFFSNKFPRNKILLKICHFLISAVSVTVSATLFTLPLQMLFFPTVSLNFLVSNILAVWAVAPAMFIAIFLLPIAFYVPLLSGVAIFVIILPLKYINQVIYLMGDTFRLTASSDNIWLILTAICMLTGALLLWFKKLSPSVFASVALTSVILSTIFSTISARPEITLWGENGSVCISVYNKNDLLNIGAPSSYDGSYFAQNQLGRGRDQTVLLLDTHYSHFGGLDTSLADRVYSPASISGLSTEVYTQSGRLDFNGFSAEIIVAGEGVSAVRIVTDKLSLIDLSAVDPYTPLPDIPQTDILVISADYAKAPRMLSALCAKLSPYQIFVSGRGEVSLNALKELCTCQVTLLDTAGQVKIK